MSLKMHSVLGRWLSRLLNDLSGQMTRPGERGGRELRVPTCDHVKISSRSQSNCSLLYAYGYDTNTSLIAVPDHFSFLFSIQQVVMILHAHKLRPPVLFRAGLHHSELIGPHATGTNVPYLAALDELVQSRHCLFDWH